MTQSNESRTFKVHPHLIFDVIKRQSGRLFRAVGEGVSNSLDANATRCDVTLDNKSFRIVDDGLGFSNRKQIEDFFETFGTPHEKGDSVVGKYRMGRGQLFSFARTTWRTGAFTMQVDIANKGLDYLLKETRDDLAPGCTIDGELYDKLTPSDLDATVRDFKQLVAYSLIPVYLNGKLVSEDQTKIKWDHEDDFCRIKLRKTGGVKAYNLGYFVAEYPSHQFGGMGAIVVSKKALEVVFSRAEIMADCPTWKHVRKVLAKIAGAKVESKSERMNNEQREWLCRQFVAGELPYSDFADKKVFRKAPSQWISLEGVLRCSYRQPLVVLESGDSDRIAEVVNRNALALVLTPECLEWFGVGSAQEMLDALKVATLKAKDLAGRPYMAQAFDRIKVARLRDVSSGLSEKHRLVDPKDYTALEKIAIGALEGHGWHLRSICADDGRPGNDQPRKVKLGLSDSAIAWTDGRSYVAFDRDHLNRMLSSFEGIGELASTYVHEYLHDDDDSGSHQHDEEFFRRFHDIALDGDRNVFWLQRKLIRWIYSECSRLDVKVPSALRKSLDTFFNASQDEDAKVESPASE